MLITSGYFLKSDWADEGWCFLVACSHQSRPGREHNEVAFFLLCWYKLYGMLVYIMAIMPLLTLVTDVIIAINGPRCAR